MKKINEEYYKAGPYDPNIFKKLSYAKASPDKRYIKILKYFYDNGESDKFSAVSTVFKDSPTVAKAWTSENPRQNLRGYAITYFGQLVNDGLLAAKKEGRRTLFTITDEGKALLTGCGAI